MYLVYSTDGSTWQSSLMTVGGLAGNNDAWHANLGSFAAGAHIRNAIEVIDNRGRRDLAQQQGPGLLRAVKARALSVVL